MILNLHNILIESILIVSLKDVLILRWHLEINMVLPLVADNKIQSSLAIHVLNNIVQLDMELKFTNYMFHLWSIMHDAPLYNGFREIFKIFLLNLVFWISYSYTVFCLLNVLLH